VIYSKTAKYGIKALRYLAGGDSREFTTVRSVAEAVDVPADFLGKIFQSLARENVLESQKGRGGGFRLSRPGNQISLLEVVQTIDGYDVFERCIFDTKECGEGGTCPLHDDWIPIREDLRSLLADKTIADLTE